MNSLNSSNLINSALDLSQAPLPAPQPSARPALFSSSASNLKIYSPSPQAFPKAELSQPGLQTSFNLPACSRGFTQKALKHLSALRSSNDLPAISEKIALCYLLLFDIKVAKSHYWKQFTVNLPRPGMLIQLLVTCRYIYNPKLTSSLYQNQANLQINAQVELRLDSWHFELQLLLNLMQEISCISVPESTPKRKTKVKIPQSGKSKSSGKAGLLSADQVLSSLNAELIKEAIESQAKELRTLKGKLTNQQWDERRHLKAEKQS